MSISLKYFKDEFPNKFNTGINEGHKKAINETIIQYFKEILNED